MKIVNILVVLFAFWAVCGNVLADDSAERIRVACVGDSITFGDQVKQRTENCYPAVLGRALGDKYDVRNFGACGASASRSAWHNYWKLKEFRASLEFKPNIVVIMFGTNDTNPKNWQRTQNTITKAFNELIDTYSALETKPKIYLCLPVECFGSKYADEACLKLVRKEIRAVAKERGIEIINMYAALKGKKELFPDNLHPNAEGARIMAEKVFKKIAAQ